jgi:hypothetical protein
MASKDKLIVEDQDMFVSKSKNMDYGDFENYGFWTGACIIFEACGYARKMDRHCHQLASNVFE